MTFTISADDPRTIRALEIAATADRWQRWRTDDGQPTYRVPSQSEPDRSYLVTPSSCDCSDFRRNGMSAVVLDDVGEQRACKHMLAVQLYTELVRAQYHRPRTSARRRGGQLQAVPIAEPGS